jgi:hypothetical protein
LRIASRIKQIVAMGGGYFEGGNVTPAAEFNIYVDPHAARLLFEAGIPLTLIPLDCTHQALTTAKRVEAFRAMNNKSGPATAAMLDFFEAVLEQCPSIGELLLGHLGDAGESLRVGVEVPLDGLDVEQDAVEVLLVERHLRHLHGRPEVAGIPLHPQRLVAHCGTATRCASRSIASRTTSRTTCPREAPRLTASRSR